MPTIQSEAQPATPEAVHALLKEHTQEHRTHSESQRLRDLNSEKALIQDYAGRVAFELLQNALDRAEHHILVRWNEDEGVLEVANDGRPITTAPQDGKRSDLSALLTLHTSSKTAAESVGNKGVGFRSVFASADAVEVASVAADGKWWGMRLKHPRVVDTAGTRWSNGEVASFYAPQPDAVDPSPEHCTVIRLRGVKNRGVVTASIEELQQGPLTFLAARARNSELCITINTTKHTARHKPADRSFLAWEKRSIPMTSGMRSSTGLELDQGEIVVLAESRDGQPAPRSRYWSYLPTEEDAGFGVQVHADFYLSNSRRNLARRWRKPDDAGEDPADWNTLLVEQAAHCIVSLWENSPIVLREEFWEEATPAACSCPHLKHAVAKLLWEDRGALFGRMAKSAFPLDQPWPLKRYRAFFDALYAWSDYAYRHLSGRSRYLRVYDLIDRVQESGAQVIPIISGDPREEEQLPRLARPIVVGVAGQKKGRNADRIFCRSHDESLTIELPEAVLRQRTFVTTFNPKLADNLPRQGLLRFDRLEILFQLQPGADEAEHRQLLRAAWDLARQSARGGRKSLLERVRDLRYGPGWRHIEEGEALSKAGHGISSLFVPTVAHGWQPAKECGSALGPWPVLDSEKLCTLLETDAIEDACLVFGVTPLPLSDTGTIDLPEALPEQTTSDLLARWRSLDNYLRHERGSDLRRALTACRWLRSTDTVPLKHGVDGDQAPYRPVDVWWQAPTGGFRTDLLPRVVTHRREIPLWVHTLGIANPNDDRQGPGRLRAAFERLCRLSRAQRHEKSHDLVAVYRALVGSALSEDEPSPFPLLCRPVDKDGRRRDLVWAEPGQSVWHEPQDADVTALRSFRDVLHWVVRRQPTRGLAPLGLRNFKVEETHVRGEGKGDPQMAHRLQLALTEALPDLIAAAHAFHFEFHPDEAIEAFVALSYRHQDDVWIEWTFDQKTGTQGRNELGDVFKAILDDGRHELCFDGPNVPLVQCAYPLSDLFAGNRAFGPLFKDALHAWNLAPQDDQAAVRRFRSEQGLSDSEVKVWSGRLNAKILSDDARAAWVAQARQILTAFGTLSAELRPGMRIRPDTFSSAPGATQAKLQSALAALPQLVPIVDFEGPHQDALERVERRPILAEKAELNRGEWTEKNLTAWKQQLEQPRDEEEHALQMWGFKPVETLRARLGLPAERVEPRHDAHSFAAGQIPLDSLPTPSTGELALQSFGTDASSSALDAQSDEEFLRQARRKARGGKRAEDAVLTLAVKLALQWQQTDRAGFRAAFERVAKLFDQKDGNKARDKLDNATDESTMKRFLHVAQYLGNVAFDVLVPQGGELLLVEVKRVGDLNGATFFLSENERRRSRKYRQNGLPWRLWLVAGDGGSQDVTPLVDRFDPHDGALGKMAADGLRPGDWLFQLRRG